MKLKIKDISFNKENIIEIKNEYYSLNWPVVYILHNNSIAYIGESSGVSTRLNQHLANSERTLLTNAKIISDRSFNKSAVLDIESKLIEYMSADEKFILQNSNYGLKNHNYYDKEKYEKIFKEIWIKLKKIEIVRNDLRVLQNSDLFKYTPYKNLTDEQYEVVFNIVMDLYDSLVTGEDKSIIINGEAGTGKTVLAMYFLKLISDNKTLEFVSENDEEIMAMYQGLEPQLNELKIALVVPMSSLRKTLKSVVKKIKGLNSGMVIGPSDVIKKEYDILIVDEAHRLKQRKNISNYGAHDNINSVLGLDNSGTELDWILLNSRFRVFFYDSQQTIRPSDIEKDYFSDRVKDSIKYNIISQMRVQAGNDYIKYAKSIFSTTPPNEKLDFNNYELYLVDTISKLKEIIFEKETKYGLSRLVSGYGYEWKSKKDPNVPDLIIENEKLFWNKGNIGWINSKNAINEVGSIHTTQGYDLNYIGLIIGPEITYNKDTQKVEVIKENYYDKNGKNNTSHQELFNYVMNIYGVLMTRAILGTYIYVVDDNLREYFKKYVDELVRD